MIKKHKILTTLIILFLICGAVYLYRLMFPKYKVANKEAATAFVYEHQDELNELVSRMKEAYEEKEHEKEEREKKILLIETKEFDSYVFLDDFKWLKRYRIIAIAIDIQDGAYTMDILFSDAPAGYEYFAVYYSENDEPLGWGNNIDLVEEKEGIYVQRGSYYVYETEKIIDHWYYYKCGT